MSSTITKLSPANMMDIENIITVNLQNMQDYNDKYEEICTKLSKYLYKNKREILLLKYQFTTLEFWVLWYLDGQYLSTKSCSLHVDNKYYGLTDGTYIFGLYNFMNYMVNYNKGAIDGYMVNSGDMYSTNNCFSFDWAFIPDDKDAVKALNDLSILSSVINDIQIDDVIDNGINKADVNYDAIPIKSRLPFFPRKLIPFDNTTLRLKYLFDNENLIERKFIETSKLNSYWNDCEINGIDLLCSNLSTSSSCLDIAVELAQLSAKLLNKKEKENMVDSLYSDEADTFRERINILTNYFANEDNLRDLFYEIMNQKYSSIMVSTDRMLSVGTFGYNTQDMNIYNQSLIFEPTLNDIIYYAMIDDPNISTWFDYFMIKDFMNTIYDPNESSLYHYELNMWDIYIKPLNLLKLCLTI